MIDRKKILKPNSQKGRNSHMEKTIVIRKFEIWN